MATVTVIWAAAAEVIITDGAEDMVITMAGHAVAIGTTTKVPSRRPFSGDRLLDHGPLRVSTI
jgi:hypothetical protein